MSIISIGQAILFYYPGRDILDSMTYLKELKIQYIETDIANLLQGQVEKPADLYHLFKDLEKSDKEKVIGVYLTSSMVINSFEVLSQLYCATQSSFG